jgi:hypothetical protein
MYLAEGQQLLNSGAPSVVFPATSPVMGVDVNKLTGRVRTRDYN